ncbi:MAG: nickel pincer cofactor biosynthesis protein LarC [Clostridia bacterium]|nr:nickel pincer cofactor biosynthesis protein LarC [Clostridia bacterium]
MKTLYLDCSMGAAGDMLTAALLELIDDPQDFLLDLNTLGIPGVAFRAQKSVKCGIHGTHMQVTVRGTEEDEQMHEHEHEEEHQHGHDHAHPHTHSGLDEIEHVLSHMQIADRIRREVLEIYSLIAEAESAVHGVPVSQIHFHEVGAMDAVADVTAVCLLMEEIGPDRVVASPVHVGSGQVRCAHGILPVPAPATAYLLQGIPSYGGEIKGELCTPTGAALLKHFADSFGPVPMMRTERIGYGMGKKDFERANCVRAMLGEEEETQREEVIEISCNVDDMTAEEIGFAMEKLFEAGAREAYAVPIMMKKSRPGTLLRCICDGALREKMVETFFRYTTTIGVREVTTPRHVMKRSFETIETPYGPVRLKISEYGTIRREKLEFDDLSRLAGEQKKSLQEIRELVQKCRTAPKE